MFTMMNEARVGRRHASLAQADVAYPGIALIYATNACKGRAVKPEPKPRQKARRSFADRTPRYSAAPDGNRNPLSKRGAGIILWGASLIARHTVRMTKRRQNASCR